MSAHRPPRAPRWVLLVLGLALFTGHGVILRYASSRVALPAVALAAVVVLVLIKHLGLGLIVRAWWRHRFRH